MSILYSNAIVSVRSGKMLNADRIRRMVATNSGAEAAKILFECGYDENLVNEFNDNDDEIINLERKKTVESFSELCVDENLRYAVLAKFDYHNATALYTANITESDKKGQTPDSVYPFGNIAVEILKHAISKKNYGPLPDLMASALSELDGYAQPSAATIELVLSRALYSDILPRIDKTGNQKIKEFFTAEIDILNLRTAAKLKLFGGNREDFIIEGGVISPGTLSTVFTKNLELIKSDLHSNDYGYIAEAYAKSIINGDLTLFENIANNFLIRKSAENSDDSFALNMLFHWFIAKLDELRIVKIILMGKKFGKTKEELREQLRGVI